MIVVCKNCGEIQGYKTTDIFLDRICGKRDKPRLFGFLRGKDRNPKKLPCDYCQNGHIVLIYEIYYYHKMLREISRVRKIDTILKEINYIC